MHWFHTPLSSPYCSNSNAVGNAVWGQVVIRELFVLVALGDGTDDLIQILAEFCHSLFHRLLHEMFIRIHAQKQFIVLELAQGPDSSQVPTRTPSVWQTLHNLLDGDCPFLCRRRAAHCRWGIGNPGAPVILAKIHSCMLG